MATNFIGINPGSALQSGLQVRESFQNAPLRRQQLEQRGQLGEQQVQAGGIQLGAARQEAQLRGVVDTAFKLKSSQPDMWAGILQSQISRVTEEGGDASQSKKILELVNAGELDKVSQAADQQTD